MLCSYISPHGGSTEQQLGTDAEPPRSFELYPPELPCWQDQWLSKITETKNNVNYSIVTPVGTKMKKRQF